MANTSYAEQEKKYVKTNHDRRCINGKITGSGKCVGYCNYNAHPGYLTESLRKEHNCVNNRCMYYSGKEKKQSEELASPFSILQKE